MIGWVFLVLTVASLVGVLYLQSDRARGVHFGMRIIGVVLGTIAAIVFGILSALFLVFS
jgi:hypothetical protein